MGFHLVLLPLSLFKAATLQPSIQPTPPHVYWPITCHELERSTDQGLVTNMEPECQIYVTLNILSRLLPLGLAGCLFPQTCNNCVIPPPGNVSISVSIAAQKDATAFLPTS